MFGKGGVGKTWLMMDIARSIGGGIPFLGYNTIKTDVIYIDFENPESVLNLRAQKLGDAENVWFWRVNNPEIKPPKLDKPDWTDYKSLPKGSVLIFDTLRAAHGKDENASDAMNTIMERVKELRDMGFTIILLHHTPKNSDKIAKGSTAIVDLADHILGLTRVRKTKDGQEVVIDDDESAEDVVYRFGVREKTRFEPYHVYLTLNPDRGFELAPDPQESTLKEMGEMLSEKGPMNKTALVDLAKSQLRVPEKKGRKLVDIGNGRYWRVGEKGQRNSQLVTPIQFGSSAGPIGVAKLPNWIETMKPQQNQRVYSETI